MNTAVSTDAEHSEDSHGDDHDHGLSDVGYIKIALILAVLTAVEVATYFWDFGVLEVPSLLILMVVKFQIVVSISCTSNSTAKYSAICSSLA